MELQSLRKLVINLPSRQDRLEQFRKELPKLFFDPSFEIISGVEGDIVAAHKTALEYARYCNFPAVLIMEDDLRLSNSPNLIKYTEEAFKSLKTDFKCVSGGVYGGSLTKVDAYWSEVMGFAGAHFLIYRQEVYDQIINHDFGTTHYDRRLSSICKCAVLNQFIATQQNGYSDHRKKTVNDDHYLNGFKMLI